MCTLLEELSPSFATTWSTSWASDKNSIFVKNIKQWECKWQGKLLSVDCERKAVNCKKHSTWNLIKEMYFQKLLLRTLSACVCVRALSELTNPFSSGTSLSTFTRTRPPFLSPCAAGNELVADSYTGTEVDAVFLLLLCEPQRSLPQELPPKCMHAWMEAYDMNSISNRYHNNAVICARGC